MEDDIRAVLAGDARIEAIYLHGSAVRGHLREESDIDIGLLLDPGAGSGATTGFNEPGAAEFGATTRPSAGGLDTGARNEYAIELETRLGREIDIGIVSSRNLVYTAEVLLRGRRIFTRDRERVELAEATLLGMWVRFNDERQEVLRAYTAG